jgi:hypothetical protein
MMQSLYFVGAASACASMIAGTKAEPGSDDHHY